MRCPSSPLSAARPIQRFDEFVESALYGPDGFYTSTGRAGLDDGDFTTSVETSALFGSCLANYLDQVWLELGQPDPFVVVEGGSGPGRLCRDVLLSVEQCRDAIRYVMVERSAAQRQEAFERVVATCFPGQDEVPVAAAPDLPSGPFVGVVFANELADNLPVRLMERGDSSWSELFVEDGRFVAQPADAAAAAMASRLAPGAQAGQRLPLALKAAVWRRRAEALLERGRVLLIDYGVTSSSALATRPSEQWLRAYVRHRQVTGVLAEPGRRDITCEVPFDQLGGQPDISNQADWLRQMGLEELTAGARARWDSASAAPDAAAVAARRSLDEAALLTASPGLGDFLVAEWSVVADGVRA